MMQEQFDQLSESVKTGNRKAALAATKDLMDKAPPSDILATMLSAMEDVGRRFKANELFVPEVLLCARAMKGVMALLEPALTAAGLAPTHSVVIGTVAGDLHDIGKNLVAMMLKGANFNVIDLGVDVEAESFIEAVEENQADIVCLSSLLTTTMGHMQDVIELLQEKGMDTKVMIGGAPISQAFADKIGATAYTPDAPTAVAVAKQLVAM